MLPNATAIFDIVFDKTVEIIHTKFSTNAETLLTGFGGSVSSGRTLLWILVSLLGVSQVKFLILILRFPLKVIQRIRNFIQMPDQNKEATKSEVK